MRFPCAKVVSAQNFNQQDSAASDTAKRTRQFPLAAAGLYPVLLLFLLVVLAGCSSPDEVYAHAHLKLSDGDFAGALSDADKGIRESKGDGSVWNMKFRILKAEILLSENSTQQALQLLDFQVPLGASFVNLVVLRKTIQARALCSLRQFSAAKKLLAEAEELAARRVPELLGDVALAEGTLFLLTKEYERAEQDFQESLQSAHIFHNSTVEARVLFSLGLLRSKQERYDEAIDRLADSLKLARAQHAHALEATIDLNLGLDYLELGDLKSAIEPFKRAESLATELGLRETRIESIVNLGKLYLNAEDNSQSKDYFLRALSLLSDSDEDRTWASASYDGLASLALEVGNLSEADVYNGKAIALTKPEDSDDLLADFEPLLTEARIARARSNYEKAEALLLTVMRDPSRRGPVYWRAEAEMASIYAASGRVRDAEATFSGVVKTLIWFRSELLRTESRLAFSTNAAEFYSSYIRFLLAQNQILEALAVADLGRAATLSEGLNAVKYSLRGGNLIQRAQSFLKKSHQVILVYWLAHEESFLWAVTPSEVRFFRLPSQLDLTLRVHTYKKALLGSDLSRADRLGSELYDLLVQPAQSLIPEGSHVVIIPDGSLDVLNFETLRTGVGHYWIEEVEIESARSIELLIKSRPNRLGANPTLLLIGNPVQVSLDYPVLPNAGTEMSHVKEHFSRPIVIEGGEAIPDAYANANPDQFDIIHFVTHGTAMPIRPLDSAIILSPGTDNSYKLYARNIFGVRIRADLVVISSCYGAGVELYAGEGLIGLAWAFMRAGAHHVIAGLWGVDDAAETKLMDYFYNGLSRGDSFGIALRNAKLAMLRSDNVWRTPYYWAPLQLYTGY